MALAVVTIVAWLLFHVLAQALLTSRIQARDDLEQSTVGRLIDNVTTEEDDAWAIYNPPTDVLGKSNSDGHEVDFFARDGQQRPYFWAYNYDAAAQTVTRYRFGSPGDVPTPDTTYTGITKFYSQTYPITALQDNTTPIYSSLYNGASLQSGTVHFYSSMPWIAGGNNITYVHIEGTTIKQDLQLATQTAPSGFTVVVYYTPSPAPTATPAPSQFKTWPANLIVGASGAGVNVTSGDLSYVPPKQWIARALNGLLGGGIALAAQECSAMAMDASGTAPDTSIDGTPAQSALDIHVDSNGCEVDATDVPLASPVMVAWEPSGTSKTFFIGNNGCATEGTAQIGPFNPYSGTGANVELDTAGKAAGSCTVTLTDGVSTQTPAADSGSVGVTVQSMSLAEVGNGDSCTTVTGRSGIITMHCTGSGSAIYGPNCGASGSEFEAVLSGNGSDAGPVWGVDQTVALSALPTTRAQWATELNNALTNVLRYGSGRTAPGVTTVTSGCPLGP